MRDGGEGDPTFGGEDTDWHQFDVMWKKQKIRLAVEEGIVWITTALMALERTNSFKEWFGSNAERQRVRKQLAEMLNAFDLLHILEGSTSDCAGGKLAFVKTYRSGGGEFRKSERRMVEGELRYVVHLCEMFYEMNTSPDFFYGTLVHEVAHHFGPRDVNVPGGGNDPAYGEVKALKLATTDATLALDNADNYRLFVFHA